MLLLTDAVAAAADRVAPTAVAVVAAAAAAG